jgi:hydrogenase/urease accessory protein HupE
VFRLRWWIVPLALLFPATADAHLVTTGFGPFYDGISHLLLSPDDLLGAVALALLAGLGGTRSGRLALLVLPAAWLAGGLAGLQAPGEILLPALPAVSLLIVGVLVALDRRLPAGLVAGLAAIVGGLHGVLNGSAMVAGGGLMALAGIAATVFVIVALLAATVVSLRALWARTVVRVAGSWIAAIGLLMLGWALRAG